jgi:hypothetical protein
MDKQERDETYRRRLTAEEEIKNLEDQQRQHNAELFQKWHKVVDEKIIKAMQNLTKNYKTPDTFWKALKIYNYGSKRKEKRFEIYKNQRIQQPSIPRLRSPPLAPREPKQKPISNQQKIEQMETDEMSEIHRKLYSAGPILSISSIRSLISFSTLTS